MLIGNKIELLDNFRKICRKHKLRVTPQRVLIYEEVINSKDHPSADVLYKRIIERCPEVSFDTVYRTLAKFASIGLIEQIDGFGTSMRFDPMIGQHFHFRCRQCGNIIDFEAQCYENLAIPDEIAERHEVTKLQVTLEGICSECIKKSAGG